jgi:predicted dehydrogenase
MPLFFLFFFLFFCASGITVAALWCRTEDKVAPLKEEFPDIPLITTKYDEILGNPEILLISIITPPMAHKDMALKALRAGKHVLQDKPTALNAQEAAEMYEEAAKRPGQLSLIDHELRFLRTYQQIRTLVQDKKNALLGELRSVEVDVSMQQKADAPWTWWQSEELGGGILGAIGSHYVDLLSWILGDRIVSVGGFLDTLHKSVRRPRARCARLPVMIMLRST